MKLKLLVSRGGLDFSQVAGQEIEVSEGEGLRLVEAGQAVSLEPTKPEPTKPEEAPAAESTETKKPAKAASKSKAAAVKSETEAPTS